MFYSRRPVAHPLREALVSVSPESEVLVLALHDIGTRAGLISKTPEDWRPGNEDRFYALLSDLDWDSLLLR